MKRLFTVDEANRTLPVVREKISTILHLRKKINHLLAHIPEHGEETLELHALKHELEHLYTHLTHAMEHLELIGVIVKDINQGLVDFSSEFEGREVFLCWKHGEDKVKYWHETNDGAFARKPILYIE